MVKNNRKEEWDGVWKSKTLISRLVDMMRFRYNKRLLRLLKPYLNKDKTFCELGCGTSTLLAKVSCFTKEVYGLDYSKEALLISKKLFRNKKISNAKFIKDNCLGLKTRKKFDVVWSQGLIEHFENPGEIIRQHLKITKKGGMAIISVPYRFGFMNPWYKITRPRILRTMWPWTDQIFFDKKLFVRELRKYSPEQDNFWVQTLKVHGLIILFVRKQ